MEQKSLVAHNLHETLTRLTLLGCNLWLEGHLGRNQMNGESAFNSDSLLSSNLTAPVIQHRPYHPSRAGFSHRRSRQLHKVLQLRSQFPKNCFMFSCCSIDAVGENQIVCFAWRVIKAGPASIIAV